MNKWQIDLNNAVQGEILKDDSLIIQNTGTEPLEFKLLPNCDCVKVFAEKAILQANESIAVQICLGPVRLFTSSLNFP